MEKYSRQDLQHLLDTPELLASLYQSTHPQAQHNLQALTETWSTNRSIAGTASLCPSTPLTLQNGFFLDRTKSIKLGRRQKRNWQRPKTWKSNGRQNKRKWTRR